MTRVEVKNKVIEVLSEQLGVHPNKIKESSKIVEDLGADSLDVIEMVMSLEETFNKKKERLFWFIRNKNKWIRIDKKGAR